MADKLRICGLEYLVAEGKTDDPTAMAQVEFPKKRITLHRGMDSEYKLLCTLHEAVHVIYHEAGLSDKTEEETNVSVMASGFFNLLRENPKFFKKYLDKL